jgi:hypothetical protein
MNDEFSRRDIQRKVRRVFVSTFVEKEVAAPQDWDLKMSRAQALLIAWLIREEDRQMEKGAA